MNILWWHIVFWGVLRELKHCGQVVRLSPGPLAASSSGQAIVELSIFGAIFLMVLATLISYGLKYNYIQKAEMQAFRTAMKIAADPDRGSSSYMMIQDRHIPDPVEPFGIGSVMPVVTSASVTRTHRMDSLAETEASLSSVVYDIQSEREDGAAAAPNRLILKNAGWRSEYNLLEEGEFGMSDENANRLHKYVMLYGTILGKKGAGWEPVSPDGEYEKESHRPDRTCVAGYESAPDSETGATTWICTQYAIEEIRIIDPCVGNLSDYSTCYDIARKIVDAGYCTDDCKKTCPYAKDPSACPSTCENHCNAEMNPPNQATKGEKGYNVNIGGAWYADNWSVDSGGNYVFPVLNALFSTASSATKALGLQSSMKGETTRGSSFRKVEKQDSIETVETAQWLDKTTRTFLVNENLITAADEDFVNAGKEKVYDDAYSFTDHVEPHPYTSVDRGSVDQTWKTEK